MKIKELSRAHLPEIFLLILISVMGIFLFQLTDLYPTNPDALGYVIAGESFSKGRGLTYTDANNINTGPFFYPHAFRMVTKNTDAAVSGYPPGYPVLMGVSVLLTGQEKAAYYLIPFLALLAIPLTYWLSWLLTESKWIAFWSSFLLAGTITFWQFSTAPWSEIPSLICLVSGVGAYLFSRQRIDAKRTAFIVSIIGGALIGYSFFIRFTNIFLVMPTLVFYELYTARLKLFGEKTRWWFFLVTGLFAGGVLLFNWRVYGGPLNSIYSTPELGAYPWPYFSLKYVFGASPVSGFSFYAAMKTLWDNFHIFLLLTPFGWIYMKRPNGIISAGVVLSTLVLYSVYAFAASDTNTRFLLPMFPFLSIAMAAGGVILSQKYVPSRYYPILAGIAAALLIISMGLAMKDIQIRNDTNVAIVGHVQQLTSQVPDDAVWISIGLNDLVIAYADQSALNYRRMIVAHPNPEKLNTARYEACLVQSVDRLLEAGIPVYYRVEDGWRVDEILNDYFVLANVQFNDGVFRLTEPNSEGDRHGLAECSD